MPLIAESIRGQRGLNRIRNALRSLISCAVVCDKCDSPNRVLCPLRVKRHSGIVLRGQVLHRCLIRVSRTGAVQLCVPAEEVITFPCERVCGQRLFLIIAEAHRIHGPRTAVRAEGNGITIRAPGGRVFSVSGGAGRNGHGLRC